MNLIFLNVVFIQWCFSLHQRWFCKIRRRGWGHCQSVLISFLPGEQRSALWNRRQVIKRGKGLILYAIWQRSSLGIKHTRDKPNLLYVRDELTLDLDCRDLKNKENLSHERMWPPSFGILTVTWVMTVSLIQPSCYSSSFTLLASQPQIQPIRKTNLLF